MIEVIHVSETKEFENWINPISDLTAISFDRRVSTEFLRWQYANNPASSDVYFTLAIADGEIAASYSVSPRTLCREGQTLTCAYTMTTMTHPNYRGRGLFPLLANALFDRLAKDGRELVYGLPNSLSNHTFIRRLEWNPVMDLPTFSAPLGTAHQDCPSRFVKVSRLPKNAEITPLPDTRWAIERTATYLRWRYEAHPENTYEFVIPINGDRITEFAVIKPYGRDSLDIVEFHAKDADSAAELLDAISIAGISTERATANMWIPFSHPLRGDLERWGFSAGAPVYHFGFRHTRRSEFQHYELARQWNIHMGDSDVF